MAETAALDPELVDALERLRLEWMAASLPERLALAEKQEIAFDELLLMLPTTKSRGLTTRPVRTALASRT
jgi:hypothetical protein